jgi:hypothetical protein
VSSTVVPSATSCLTVAQISYGLGLDIDEMMEITEIVQIFVIGYAQREVHTMQAMAATGATEPAQMYPHWHPYVRSLVDSGEHPYLRRVILDARGPHESDPQAPFERALDRLIAGIAASVTGTQAGHVTSTPGTP